MDELQPEQQPLTIRDIAEELGVTEQTVYNYVRQNKITPFNKEAWHVEGEFHFNREDIDFESLKKRKPGLTTGEVAGELGVSITTVLNHIRSGSLRAEQQVYNGKKTYFIQPVDLENYKQEYPIRKKVSKKNFYDRKHQVCLYQSFKNPTTNELARIHSIDEEIKLITEDGQIFKLEELTSRGFHPMYSIKEGSYNTKRGYAKFRFIKPANIHSVVFDFMDLVYMYAGPLNVRVMNDNDHLQVEVKPTLLKGKIDDLSEVLQVAKQSITSGKIISRYNGILLESDLELIPLHVPSKVKHEVKSAADEQNQSVEEFILESIKARLNQRRS